MIEKQSFHAFITALAVFSAVFVNFLLVYQTQLNAWFVFGIMIFNSAFALLFLIGKLTSIYTREKITLRFFPFIWKEKNIYWTDVNRAYVRQYSPLREYGGWGFRISIRNGRAYNTKGNMGLQLELKNGKKILIGTQQAMELQNFLSGLYADDIVKPEYEQA